MPDQKISQLPEIPTTVTTGDILIAVRSGTNYKVPASKLPQNSGGETIDLDTNFGKD